MQRRDFIKSLGLGAASLAFLNSTLSKARSLPATGSTNSIQDVEHIVVFMQENRSFDHYFGHLSGVKGYSDRFPLILPGGKPVWHQPRMENPEEDILPFHLNTKRTSAQLIQDLDHDWGSQHEVIAGGLFNGWALNNTNMAMGYFLRDDIPFHYALADSFTICDHYFCSIDGPTDPNRLVLWSGTVDPSGAGGGPLIDDNDHICIPDLPPFTWTTYPERLEKEGISWQVYQEGIGKNYGEIDGDPFTGNYGDNALQDFAQFVNASKESALFKRGMSIRTLSQLKDDVINNKLRRVWGIVAPAAYCKHPPYPATYGAMYMAKILDALTTNPNVWGKTVLFLNYDENDGFFDHVPPPQPPTPVLPGKSTVSTEGEIHNFVNTQHEPLYVADQLPYGLGPRVPMVVISPWSRGGYVCSEIFDHTSVIRFIEKRFGVVEPNITPWRRAVCGDLTSAFDFSRHDVRMAPLPKTESYKDLIDHESTLPAPEIPRTQSGTITPQEKGSRPTRPLPYDLNVVLRPHRTGVQVDFDNRSKTGISCYAYWDASSELPQRYTIGAGHQLQDAVPLPQGQQLAMTVYGPNSFVRKVAGVGDSVLLVNTHSESNGNLRLSLKNEGKEPIPVQIRDMAYNQSDRALLLISGLTEDVIWDLQPSHHWYDLTIDTPNHRWRLAGHVENGKESLSDPANITPETT